MGRLLRKNLHLELHVDTVLWDEIHYMVPPNFKRLSIFWRAPYFRRYLFQQQLIQLYSASFQLQLTVAANKVGLEYGDLPEATVLKVLELCIGNFVDMPRKKYSGVISSLTNNTFASPV